MADRQPYEIARETVKQLTLRKLSPTPENYQATYHEIAGTKRMQPFPEEQLQTIAKSLPTKTPGQQRLQAQFDHAVRHHNWTSVQAALVGYTQLAPTPRTPSDLAASTSSAASPSTTPSVHGTPVELASAVGHAAPDDMLRITPEVKDQINRLIEHAVPAAGAEETPLVGLGKELVLLLKQANPSMSMLRTQLANFNFKLTFVAEEQTAIKTTLLELLNLIFENVAELSLDERWLQGQMEALKSAAKPPLTLRRLEDVRARLKDVILKQIEAKAQSHAAQEEMKRLLAAFIERLSSMTESSGAFKGKVEQYAKQIEGATTLAEIAPVMQEAVTAARNMALDSQRVGDELREMREKTAETESRLHQLENDLEKASALARNDPLTGALNRKGLDEAIEREISTCKRKGLRLSVALLDIDNFKKINDEHGHTTGDAALVHLTAVARDCIRPQDSLGRYGGEEFVVVMPDTALEQGVDVMTRVQRELTKRFFLAGTDKLLITFSAGVAELGANEPGPDAVVRADQAMYLAKRSGKNRVVGA